MALQGFSCHTPLPEPSEEPRSGSRPRLFPGGRAEPSSARQGAAAAQGPPPPGSLPGMAALRGAWGGAGPGASWAQRHGELFGYPASPAAALPTVRKQHQFPVIVVCVGFVWTNKGRDQQIEVRVCFPSCTSVSFRCVSWVA